MFKFTPSELLKEWLRVDDYQNELTNLDIVAVGIEGLEVLIHLKGVYPHLQLGYIYYKDLGYLPDWNGEPITVNIF